MSGGTRGRSSVEVPDDVLVQRLSDDECVFLNLGTEEYSSLDTTGTAMWDALVETGDVGSALAKLTERFDADQEVLARDLDALVSRLVGRGLLRLRDDTA